MESPFLPKYDPPAQKKYTLWSSGLSLLAYVLISFFLLPDFRIALALLLILLLHEAGHLAAMRFFGYRETGVFFIPLLGAFASGTKRTISQKEAAIVLMAGPLPGLLLGLIFLMAVRYLPAAQTLYWLKAVGAGLILLNGINLLPVFPLDGGQLLNRVFLDEESMLGTVFVWLSALALTWLALWLKFYGLLIFPFFLLWRSRTDKHLKGIEKKIAEAGINMDTEYEALSDEDYARLRSLLIEHHPRFARYDRSPLAYDDKELAIKTMIASLLHRKLIMDLFVHEKIMIAAVWTASLLLTVLVAMAL